MKVDRVLVIHKAMSELAECKLKGNIAFRVALNLSQTKQVYDIVEEKKQEWLKSNANPDEKGEYKLENETLTKFVDFMNSVLSEDNELPEMKMVDPETDLPDDVKPSTLMPLIGVCLKE